MRKWAIVLLSGRVSTAVQPMLRLVSAVQLPRPSEIAAKIDMCENGSETVQAKYKVTCEKINDLTQNTRIREESRSSCSLGASQAACTS